MNSNQKGDISLIAIISNLVKRNIAVSLPFSDNKRYDLILDIEGKLYKAQVKTALLDKSTNYLSFRTCSYRMTSKGNKYFSYKVGEIDIFLAYCMELDKVYMAWVNEVPSTQMFLRINQTKNLQKKTVRWAKEYELDNKLEAIRQLK